MELREAIKALRENGKPVYAWAESMSLGGLHLAAACDRVVMAPPGTLIFTGLVSRSMHVKETLDKLGVSADMHQIKDYKSAAEMMIRSDMSGPAKENARWLVEEIWQMIMGDMENDRGLGEAKLQKLMEHALFTAEEAVQAGLIDQSAYWDELTEELKRDGDKRLRTLSSGTYSGITPKSVGLGGRKQIAVVYAQGSIAGRRSGMNPLLGMTMGYESVIADLRRAERNPRVAAVVFRVNSGGGSALTSDFIARQIETMKETKPVIVSMGDVAASGGYYIAYKADRVIANPLTITGSIGSISGKFAMKPLYDKLGITFDSVSKGPMGDIYSDLRRFTPAERKRFQENHYNMYNRWVSDVAEKREMSFDEINNLAQGRVWSGRQAVEHNLIDDLGGLKRAVEIAKELAEIPEDEQVALVHIPSKRGLLQILMDRDGASLAAGLRRLVFETLKNYIHEAASVVSGHSYIMDPLVIE